MKTCKYGCGGKMKEGGKVATMKKMKVGGVNKKYAMGGQTIVGMPGYNATTRPMQMKSGGAANKLKPVPEDKKNSLGKLPTAVRNKMGFQRKGGVVKKKK